jgi:hypothetical protein
MNNPLNLVDSTGKKATITSSCDEKTNTCSINVSASFAVYGAHGQNISQEDLKRFAEALKAGIEGHFSNEFEGKDGRKFVLSATIDVQVVGSEADAIAAGVDNIAEFGYSDLEEADGSDGGLAQSFGVEGESFDRMVATIDSKWDPRGSMGSSFGDIFAHEFGAHLANGGHNLFNPKSIFYERLDLSGAQTMLQEDFDLMFRANGGRRLMPPPPGQKETRTNPERPFSHILTSTLNSFEVRRAPVIYSKPTDSYRWASQVKK